MTHDNPIDWFQETMGGKFPEKMESLLKCIAGYEGTIEILFGVPKKSWRFKVLDFQLLHANMNNPAYTTDDYAERLTNPYLIVQEINEHFEDRFGEGGKPGNMLPFAVDVDGDGLVFLCFKQVDSRVYLCNINATLPLEIVVADIEELLGPIDDIIKSIGEEGKTWFDLYPPRQGLSLAELIPEENMLVCEAECTYDAKSYKWVIEALMGITDGLLTLESFEGINGDTRTIQITINGISGEFSVEGNTHYVDSAALICALNALLEPVMYGNFFIDVDDSDGALLEVAFGDQAIYELLLKNHLVAEWQMKKA
jgi:hypothetical protein